MKNRVSKSVTMSAVAGIALALVSQANAAVITKANNTTNLTTGSSWTGGVAAGSADVGTWTNTVTGANTVSLGNNLTYLGLAIVDPGGAVTINGANTMTLGTSGIDMSLATQNLTLNASFVRLASSASQTWTVASGKTLTVANAMTLVGGTTTLSLGGSGSFIFNGNFAKGGGGYQLNINGGNVSLNGTGDFSGGTSTGIALGSGAQLNIGNDSAINGARLDLNSGTVTAINGDRTIASSAVTSGLRLTGNPTVSGSNSLTFNIGASFSVNGTRSLTNNLDAGKTLTFGGSSSISNNTTARTVTFGGSGLTAITNAVSDGGGSTGSGIFKSGTGTLLISGTTSYTGNTGMSSGGAVKVTGAGQLGNGSYAGLVSIGSSTNFEMNSSAAQTFNGALSGSGSFTQSGSGTTTFAAGNSYNGGTTLSGGMLSLGHATALGTTGAILFNGGVLQFTGSNTNDYSARFSTAASQAFKIDTNGQAVSFATGLASTGGSLLKLGAGTLTLSGGSYTGTSTVSGGTLKLAGSIASSDVQVNSGASLVGNGSTASINVDGVLSPGNSLGTIDVAGMTITSTGSLVSELNPTALTSDLVNATGNVLIDTSSVLSLSILSGTDASVAAGTVFTLVDYDGTATGNFSTLPEGTQFTLGANDYVISYHGNYDSAGTTQTPGTAVTLTVVPEPASLSMLGLGAIALLRRRRK